MIIYNKRPDINEEGRFKSDSHTINLIERNVG